MNAALISRSLFFSRPKLFNGVRNFQSSFATCSVLSANRAVVYTSNGDPSQVLSTLTYPKLSPPPPNTVNIRFILSPINPADINVIEGVYPAKPSPNAALSSSGKGSRDEPVFVAGNEGLAEVINVGDGVTHLQTNDWVVMTRQQAGTWSTSINVKPQDILKVPRTLNEVEAATITVNPPTAYNMLHDFTQLNEGDWVIQNGANGAVGQAVIQIAAAKGLRTINLIRNRSDVQSLTRHLSSLGATHVATYDELSDKSFRQQVKEWTEGKNIRLGLNCVSGKSTTLMARLLGQNAHLVSYGAMSKEPLSLPTSLFIFKNLTCHGFWQSRWYNNKSASERDQLVETLVGLMRAGKLREPAHEILTIRGSENDEEASQKIRHAMTTLAKGQHGKKILLKMEETP